MSAYADESVDMNAEIERRTAERVAAKLEEHGIRDRASDEVIQADIAAANNSEELNAVLAKHRMLQESY